MCNRYFVCEKRLAIINIDYCKKERSKKTNFLKRTQANFTCSKCDLNLKNIPTKTIQEFKELEQELNDFIYNNRKKQDVDFAIKCLNSADTVSAMYPML